jgi:hypothetical protein
MEQPKLGQRNHEIYANLNTKTLWSLRLLNVGL